MNNELENMQNVPEEEQPAAAQAWEDTSQSDMIAVETAEEAYALPQKRSLNRGTMILLASCLLGVGTIYLLHLRQQPSETSAEQKEVEARVDTALAKLVDKKQKQETQEVLEDTEKMVQAFYDYPSKQQISVEELQRNPFSDVLAQDKGATSVNDALKRRELLRKELNNKLSDLELQSVLQGAGGAQCLINGEVYSPGENVESTFKIKTIGSNKVILVASDMEFVLQM